MKHVHEVTCECMKRLFKLWDSKEDVKTGTIIVDFIESMTSITMEIIGLAGFGYDLGVIESKVNFKKSKKKFNFNFLQ